MPAVIDRVELAASGRYRHSRACIERVLDVAGFREPVIAEESLRRELGTPVAGWMVLARKGGT